MEKIRFRKKTPFSPRIELVQNVDQVISNLINKKESKLISRIGFVETLAVSEFIKYGNISRKQEKLLQQNAGFYVKQKNDLEKFCNINIEALLNSDLLGYIPSAKQYDLFQSLSLGKKTYTTLNSFEPFLRSENWMTKMTKKEICVVSPFIMTMKKQVDKLNLIHIGHDFQKHNFSFVASPITNCEYDKNSSDMSWFDRLLIMKESIEKISPDLVIIGAGAYGPVLGHLLKNENNISSIVSGGATQLLFGVIGKRWEKRQSYRKLFNKNWRRPSANEIPKGHEKVEDGCYW